MQDSQQNSTETGKHPLRMPLWVIAICLVIQLVFEIIALIFPQIIYEQYLESAVDNLELPEKLTRLENETQQMLGLEDFSELPLQERISLASVIAVTRYTKTEGVLKAVITDILKHEPGTKFHFKVGDEYRDARLFMKEGINYGDGAVMFFIGSPAQSRLSMTFEHERLRSEGDMPISKLVELIAAGNSGTPKKTTSPKTEIGEPMTLEYFNNIIQEKTNLASVIAVARYVEMEGEFNAVITHILKHEPGTEFYFNVGDEYQDARRSIEERVNHRDGVVMFFTGSPAQFNYSITFEHERLRSAEDMPLDKLVELILIGDSSCA